MPPAACVARYFIGLTTGIYDPGLTVEDMRDHFDEIRDEDGYIVPDDPPPTSSRKLLAYFKGE